MTFTELKDVLHPGAQIRLVADYGAFPIRVPAGATATVVEVRLDAVDPVIDVVLDDICESVPDGLLQIRGPETDDDWGDPAPVEIVSPAQTGSNYRRCLVEARRAALEQTDAGARGSDPRYDLNGRGAAMRKRIMAVSAALTSMGD